MIGLGSYAFFWQQSARNPKPLTLAEAFAATKTLGVDLFQICDYAPLIEMSEAELQEAAATAKNLGLTIELGTKGIEPEHLELFLKLAGIFDAKLVRSMVYSTTSKPTLQQAAEYLHQAMPAFEAAGVTLALETYEQISTDDLAELVRQNGSPNLGICLDPANVVARFEHPKHCVEVSAPLVKNIHVKDFAFSRQDGWVGFTYTGEAMGAGSHDYQHLLATVQPRQKGINEIVEHWLPWQGDIEATIDLEKRWTKKTVEYLRSTN
jgi:sugar phosphate isomerase/epimerase